MTVWTLHLLNARKRLFPVMDRVRATARDAVARSADHIALPSFDLIVRAGDGAVSNGGIVARTPGPGVIEVTLAPGRMDPAVLLRLLVRQMAHLVRRDGPGRDRSLGEALTGEGLAGHFVLDVLGGQPDALDTVRPAPGVMRQAMHEWARRDHDPGRWFDGTGDLRRGTGTGLGHRIVAEHLARNPDDRASRLLAAPAEPFRQSLRRLAAETQGEGRDEDRAASDG